MVLYFYADLNTAIPGFSLTNTSQKARSESPILADKLTKLKQKSFSQLSEHLGKFIPKKYLEPTSSGDQSRQRLYSKQNTFWAFFSQVLDVDGGCKEIVRKLQAVAAMKNMKLPSSSTSAYCQARSKLDIGSLSSVLTHTSEYLQRAPNVNMFNGRRVIVVDGTGISMPDTEKINTFGLKVNHKK